MSVVLVKKIDKGFVMMADSQATMGQTTASVVKCFHSKQDNNIIIGVVGTLRDLNVLQSSSTLFDNLSMRRGTVDTDDMILNTVNNIKQLFEKEGRLLKSEKGLSMQSCLLIAYKDKCWVVEQDFAVQEVEDFYATGSPYEMATGAYLALSKVKNIDDIDKLRIVADICINNTIYVNYPVYQINTYSNDILKYNDLKGVKYENK